MLYYMGILHIMTLDRHRFYVHAINYSAFQS